MAESLANRFRSAALHELTLRAIRAPLLRPSLGLEEGRQFATARVLPPRQGRGARV